MKKTLVTMLVVVLLSLSFASVASAYGGVSGQLLGENGSPWTHGGEVYVFTDMNEYYSDVEVGPIHNGPTYLWGTGTIDSNGNFSFDFGDDQVGNGNLAVTSTDQDNKILEVVIIPNAGPDGTPPIQSHKFNNYWQIDGLYHLGSVNTGTGPNVVALKQFETITAGIPQTLPNTLLAVALLVLAAAIWKRQNTT